MSSDYLKILTVKDGSLTAKIYDPARQDFFLLHSLYSPQKEAKKQIDNFIQAIASNSLTNMLHVIPVVRNRHACSLRPEKNFEVSSPIKKNTLSPLTPYSLPFTPDNAAQSPILFFLGLGLGYQFFEFVNRTDFSFSKIFIVEKRSELFAYSVLSMHSRHVGADLCVCPTRPVGQVRQVRQVRQDSPKPASPPYRRISNWSGLIGKDNIRFFIDCSIEEIIEKLPSDNFGNVSNIYIFKHPVLFEIDFDYYSEIIRYLSQITKQWVIGKGQGIRTQECKPVGTGHRACPTSFENKTILSFSTTGSAVPFTLADCQDAFCKLGHQVCTIEMQKEQSSLTFTQTIIKTIAKYCPDFIFTIDMVGLLPAMIRRFKIPFISWFFDNPFIFFDLKNANDEYFYKNFICDNYYIFCWDKIYVEELFKIGFKNVYYLPFAANPEIFKKQNISEKQFESYACDISFVGNSGSEEDGWYRQKFIKLLDNLYLQDKRVETHNCASVLKGTSHSALRTPHSLNIHLYGDEGWKNIESMNAKYRGKANNRTELPIIYNVSKINLNLTAKQLLTALPIRVFDILSAGGFLLTDFKEGLFDVFEIGKDIVCFRTEEEFLSCVEYYLEHSEERNQIALHGRNTALNKHTYVHRIQEILDTVDKKHYK